MADGNMYGLAFNPADIATDYKRNLTENMDRQASAMNLATKRQEFSDQQAQRQTLQQNVNPETGELNQDAAIKQFMPQNPVLAQKLKQNLNQMGIDGATQHAEMAQNALAGASQFQNDPEGYKNWKNEMVGKGFPEFSHLPDVYIPSLMQNALVQNGTGAQKLEMIKTQAAQQNQRYMEMIKEFGVVPSNHQNFYNIFGSDKRSGDEANPHLVPNNNLPPQAQGLQPGDTIPMGKRDIEAQKAYDDALGARKQNDPAYATAGSNLLAVNNAMSIFNKHKNLNDISTQEQHILAGEAAKAIKGGASPTQDEVDALLPGNVSSRGADLWAKISSKPAPTNNAEYYQSLKDYFGDLKQNSMSTIKTAHDYAAQTALARGISKQSLAIKQNAANKELQGLSNNQPQAYSADVVNYAKSHGISPEQANKIKMQRTGGGQ